MIVVHVRNGLTMIEANSGKHDIRRELKKSESKGRVSCDVAPVHGAFLPLVPTTANKLYVQPLRMLAQIPRNDS